MGMPSACYSKALREPVHFLWERRVAKNKMGCAQFRSRAADGLAFGTGQLVYDHAIPFKFLLKELLELREVSTDSVREVLGRHCIVVLITKQENQRLNSLNLGSNMPTGWDHANPLARYAAAGIEIVENSSQ
jgi:hypothetical protein